MGKSCCPGNTASHLNISLERGVPWGPVPVPGRSSSAGLGRGAQEGLQTPTAGGCQAMPYLWGQRRCHSGRPGSQLGPLSSSSSGSRWSLVGPAAPCPGGAKPGTVECVPMAQGPPREHPWGRQCHSRFTRVQHPQPHEHPPTPPVLPSAHLAPRQHPPSPQRSQPSAAGGTSCSPGSAQKLPPGWPGRGREIGEHPRLGKHPWPGERPLRGAGCRRLERGKSRLPWAQASTSPAHLWGHSSSCEDSH